MSHLRGRGRGRKKEARRRVRERIPEYGRIPQTISGHKWDSGQAEESM